jgi:hypothetical protein
MERTSHESYPVRLWEQLVINFALPPDLLYHTLRAIRERDRSQTTPQRIAAMWKGKVAKYQKLLRVKDENNGVIPDDFRELCSITPCGRVRLMMAEFSGPRRLKGSNGPNDRPVLAPVEIEIEHVPVAAELAAQH